MRPLSFALFVCQNHLFVIASRLRASCLHIIQGVGHGMDADAV